MNRLILVFLIFSSGVIAQHHPIAFATKSELGYVSKSISNNFLLKESYSAIKKDVDSFLTKDIDVPFPKDPAGGYTHDQHKFLYTLMFNSGTLYQITGDKNYAELVKKLFLKYAALNPTLKNHPQATSAYAGKLFWQALNDANWLVYTGMAFDCIHDYLTPAERSLISNGAFKPIVDYFTRDQKMWFNLIHNHAVWACAGVGIVGIATENEEYINMALYGTEKDGKAGFLAQMNGLFSPDGFYHEGPYYTRYALLPFYLFANAINNVRPALKIFSFRNSILKKALEVALNQTNISGEFFSYNDALKDKTYLTNEIVVAVNIAWQVYGVDSSLLAISKFQNRVLLNKGGVEISNALNSNKSKQLQYKYHSAEYTDGANGDFGGLSVMRNGKDKNFTSLIYKYTSHGLSHGHYDKLNIQMYDNGNEILQDYGAARFINIEHKWGGRYLPETNAYAQQTIAHNTITVDETSHYNGKENVAELNHPNKLFGKIGDYKVQYMSAEDTSAYKDVIMHRSNFLIKLPALNKPLVVDIFKTTSSTDHQYDLPFNYLGTLMKTNFKYQYASNSLSTLGNKNGYQFLWKEASAKNVGPFTQFTFLNHNTFYTISSLANDSVDVFFTRIGASDSNFNLRRDPSYIIRTKGQNQTYINVVEPHGNFSAVSEIANQSFSSTQMIKKLQDDDDYTIAEITVQGKKLLVVQANKNFSQLSSHEIKNSQINIKFTGPVYVEFDGANIQ